MAHDKQAQIEQRNEILLEALAAGFSHEEAAETLNISSRTVRRTLEDPDFKSELRRRRAAHTSESAGRLSSMTWRALDVLVDVMEMGRDSDRLTAARMTLEWAHRSSRESDLRDQLDRIESLVDNQEAVETSATSPQRPDDFLPL